VATSIGDLVFLYAKALDLPQFSQAQGLQEAQTSWASATNDLAQIGQRSEVIPHFGLEQLSGLSPY